jgi:filamentous hemagglutinin family protein
MVMKFNLLSQGWQWHLVGSVAIVGTFFTAVEEQVLAQIVPDNTLGAESSVVIPDVTINGIPSDQIEGGAIRGANLFHSFEQFSILQGRGAYFANPAGITNILSRVTGANRSDILGRLGVLGNANLFLINPNGIVFGPDASLDVQGSFVATTADAVRLGDGGLFSASEPGSSNLLTVSPSALWFNAVAAQPIINQSQADSLIGQPNVEDGPPGLQVPVGQTLALVGGDVLLEGGNLTAAGGRIELGSVAGVGEVSLNPIGNGFELRYGSDNRFGDISLSNGAFVDVSGERGGDIQIRGARLEMTQLAFIRADTLGTQDGGEVRVKTTEEVVLSESSLLATAVFGSGTGGNLTIETGKLLVQGGSRVVAVTGRDGNSGNLQINASESVEVIGKSATGRVSSGLFTSSAGTGEAGDLTINTGRLLVNGAQVSAGTFAEGKGGNLQINALESVEVIGAVNDLFPTGIFTQSDGSGEAGDLTIITERLLVNEAQVSASTRTEGKGGNLQIKESESVELIGKSADSRFPSGLFTSSRGSGAAGDLTIDTERLLVNGAAVFAQSLGSGNAGELSIDAERLLVSNGAQISTLTLGEGEGGRLRINASESVEVIGESANGRVSSGLFTRSEGSGNAGQLTIITKHLLVSDGAQVSASTLGEGKGNRLEVRASESIEVIGRSADGQAPSGLFSSSEGSGDAGELSLETSRLLLRDGAEISSNSLGEGRAGDINIKVRDTLEANNGTIRTDSDRSPGGALTIEAGDIRLWGDSDIRSSVASGKDNGGEIKLTADSILAFDDSDILAFARDGDGGDIKLNTPAFFGQNYRPAPRNTDPDTLDNNNRVDINATGAVSGDITLPDTTFIENSLTELPNNQIDTDSLLASSCIVRRNQPKKGSFFITGTGGFAQRPGDAQMSTFPTVDIETLPSDSTIPNRPWQKGDPIIEPQGVYRLPNGKLVLSRECPD